MNHHAFFFLLLLRIFFSLSLVVSSFYEQPSTSVGSISYRNELRCVTRTHRVFQLLYSSVEKERGEKMPDSMIKVFLAGGGGGCSLAVVGQPLDTMYVFFFVH